MTIGEFLLPSMLRNFIKEFQKQSTCSQKNLTIKDLSNETWITREEASGPTHDYTRYFSYIVHDENTLSNISSLFLDKLLKTFINSI